MSDVSGVRPTPVEFPFSPFWIIFILAGIPVIHSRLGMDNDPALISIKLFMATILPEITAMQVSLGR